jgi:D-3-phosphoglycerate dehydrogenase
MIRILANDGIHADALMLLEEASIEVVTTKIPQDDLIQKLQDFDGIIVRSATKVRKELIEACPRLKIIVRAGVGLDNVDVDFAQSKNISVFNTPGASTRAVAELTLAHIFALSRNLHTANRSLAGKNPDFAALKKSLAGGMELKDKTVGIIGFGRIGQELAKLCLPMGMKVIAYDPYVDKGVIHYDVFGDTAIKLTVEINTTDFNKVIQKANFICVHISGKDVIIGKEQMLQMKKGACLINTSRGGVISESDLIEMLDNGHLGGAALDVFTNEPNPNPDLLNHPKISVTPHIGAETKEAQVKIAMELADKIIHFFEN